MRFDEIDGVQVSWDELRSKPAFAKLKAAAALREWFDQAVMRAYMGWHSAHTRKAAGASDIMASQEIMDALRDNRILLTDDLYTLAGAERVVTEWEAATLSDFLVSAGSNFPGASGYYWVTPTGAVFQAEPARGVAGGTGALVFWISALPLRASGEFELTGKRTTLLTEGDVAWLVPVRKVFSRKALACLYKAARDLANSGQLLYPATAE